jgi:hypothetical protein
LAGQDLGYDLNESGALDPTGNTGGLTSGALETNTDADTCEGLSSYRSSGSFSASDKGGNSGSVVGEVAWLIQVIPQKFPGLTVMSSYRSIRWNLTNAYHIPASIAERMATDLENSNGSRAARMTILDNYKQYGLKTRPANAALTSNHVLGRAVDFAGPGLGTHGTALANWAETNKCIRFSEILWGEEERHTDHVHLGV